MFDFIIVFTLGVLFGVILRDLLKVLSKKPKEAKNKGILICEHEWQKIGRPEEKRMHCTKCNTEI